MFRKMLATAILIGLTAEANASLSSGDLAFTAFNADEDGWALTTFKDIAANTTIYFSDNSWNGAAFNPTESFHTWNTGLAPIAAGSVIRFSKIDVASRSVSIGSLSGSGSNFGMSASAETIYAYLGNSVTAPTTFLTAVSSEANNTSLTNAGLSAGVNAIKLTSSADFAEYNGDRVNQTVFSDYAALINNPANWAISVGGEFGGAETPVLNTTPFTIAAVPVPAAAWLFGSALVGFTLISRRKELFA